jgi:hypothetical protein
MGRFHFDSKGTMPHEEDTTHAQAGTMTEEEGAAVAFQENALLSVRKARPQDMEERVRIHLTLQSET